MNSSRSGQSKFGKSKIGKSILEKIKAKSKIGDKTKLDMSKAMNRCNMLEKSKYLDKIDINSLNYIAGPYLIDNNHWLAFIVYMIRSRVILLDPYLNRHHLKTSL